MCTLAQYRSSIYKSIQMIETNLGNLEHFIKTCQKKLVKSNRKLFLRNKKKYL